MGRSRLSAAAYHLRRRCEIHARLYALLDLGIALRRNKRDLTKDEAVSESKRAGGAAQGVVAFRRCRTVSIARLLHRGVEAAGGGSGISVELTRNFGHVFLHSANNVRRTGLSAITACGLRRLSDVVRRFCRVDRLRPPRIAGVRNWPTGHSKIIAIIVAGGWDIPRWNTWLWTGGRGSRGSSYGHQC